MKTKVIYIIGSAHSGSTMLDLLLGSHSRIESVGEIKSASIQRLWRGDTVCTCGVCFSHCSLWKHVTDRLEAAGVNRSFLSEPVSARRDSELFIAETLKRAGRMIYVESTKSISRLDDLRAIPSLDVFVVHLLRDPRAVAFSNNQKGRSLYGQARSWVRTNWAISRKAEQFPNRWLMARYENLAINPSAELRRIMTFMGEEFEAQQLRFGERTHHNLSGNRMRMRLGDPSIRPDTRYLTELGSVQWALSTTVAVSGLKLFDYPIRRKHAAMMFSDDVAP